MIFQRKIEKFQMFDGKISGAVHAPVRRVVEEEIGDFLPIFSEKNLEILALVLFYVFYLTVQISSSFLK